MDLNVSAFRIVQKLSSETKEDKRKELARSAGKIGGAERARKLSSERKKEISIAANRARWNRKDTTIK